MAKNPTNKTNAESVWKAHRQLCSAIGKVPDHLSQPVMAEIRRNPNHLVGVSLEARGQVAFARKKSQKYDVDRRVRLSFARYITRYLSTGLTDDEISRVGICVAEEIWGIDTSGVRVLSSADDIVDFYRDDGECRIGSCMSYDKCSDWIRNVYGNNENVRLLAVGNYDNQEGRAVLWRADCGTLLCDRIYPNDEGHRVHQMIRAKAEQMGAVIRNHHGAPDGHEFSREYTITLDNYYYGEGIPYMDSFYYTDEKNGSNLILSNKRSLYTLHDYENGNMDEYWCEVCGWASGDEDDLLFSPEGDRLCRDCYHERYVECEDCYDTVSRNDAYTTSDDRYICSGCREDNYSFCYDCEHLVPIDDITMVNDEPICDCCLERNYTKCEDCNKWVSNDDINYHDGQNLCDDCLEAAKEKEEEEEHELTTA